MSDEPPLAASPSLRPSRRSTRACAPGPRAWRAARPHAARAAGPAALLADRFRGAEAIALRTRPVPAAYRVLFRHLGLDPDVTRTPVEALAVERLLRGGLPARGLPEDALALATLETGVPVWACDAARSAPSSSCARAAARPARAGRRRGAGGGALLGAAARARPGASTTALRLIAVQAPGVPDLYVEEALWTTIDALS